MTPAVQAAKRAGTHATKTRMHVRGGGRKPYRQKGTGNARRGNIRTNVMKGGGVAFGLAALCAIAIFVSPLLR